MSKRYRLVIFDWEGTLSDTLGQILSTIADEARKLNFGELNEPLARQSVDLGLIKAVKRLFPCLSPCQHHQLVLAVQQALLSRNARVHLLPGVEEIITQIVKANIDLAIATNKGQSSLQRALSACGLASFFKITRSAGQTPPKPCPQMLEEILQEYAIPVDEALMVGDSVTDIEMARQINMDAIGIDFYHQQAEVLLSAGALDVFDNYQQLARFLQLSDEQGVKSS